MCNNINSNYLNKQEAPCNKSHNANLCQPQKSKKTTLNQENMPSNK